MSLPTVPQMRVRSNDGHRRALQACRDDQQIETVSLSSVRGMRTVLATLRRWECITGEGVLTERGEALLAALS